MTTDLRLLRDIAVTLDGAGLRIERLRHVMIRVAEELRAEALESGEPRDDREWAIEDVIRILRESPDGR